MADDLDALDAYSAAVIRVADSVLPSVASLRVATRRGEGAGSASVLTGDGFLLTSAHVVQGADTAVAGEPIGSTTALQRAMVEDAIGRRLEITVWRNGALVDVIAVPRELTDA